MLPNFSKGLWPSKAFFAPYALVFWAKFVQSGIRSAQHTNCKHPWCQVFLPKVTAPKVKTHYKQDKPLNARMSNYGENVNKALSVHKHLIAFS